MSDNQYSGFSDTTADKRCDSCFADRQDPPIMTETHGNHGRTTQCLIVGLEVTVAHAPVLAPRSVWPGGGWEIRAT